MNLGADILLYRGELLGNQLQHLSAAHGLGLLAFLRLAEAGLNYLCDVLLVGIVQVISWIRAT